MTPRHDPGHGNAPGRRRRGRPPPDRLVTGEPRSPLDPLEPPDLEPPSLPPGPVLVEHLDEQLPLVLFPVRLATRFHRGDGPGTTPSELWVRIFPDALHADAHHLTLTPEEVALGHAYWERLWRLGRDRAGRADAHRWLVSQLGAPRAAWVAAQTEPTNPMDAPTAPVARTSPLETKPTFTAPAEPEPSRPTLARLLPDRWYVRISQNNEDVRVVWSTPVRRDLAMAPNVADIPDRGDIRDLLRNQDLWWMADFEEAVDAGMGVRVPLEKQTGEWITDLVVFGVRDRDPGATEELAGLLDAHRFTSGLEILTPGTPTNTTPTVDAGYTDVPTDLETYLARQLNEPVVSRPPLDSPATLGTATAANALALAFGLEGTTAFDVAEHASDRTGGRAEAMNRVLWPATWGHFFTTLLAPDETPIIAGPDLDWLQDWFRDWVRGPGLLPVFRAGEQPYGVLPVTVLPDSGEFPDTRIGHLQSVLDELRYDWWHASGVSSFSEPATRTPEEEAVAVASVLGAVPHPTAFRLRRAFDRSDRFAREYEDGLTELERLLAQTNYILEGQEYEQERKNLIYNGSIDEQSYNLAGLRDIAETMIETHSHLAAELSAVRDHVDDVLWLGAVARHKVRSETRWLSESFSDATLPDAGDPALWYVEYGEDGAAADGTFPELKLVPSGGPEGDPLLVAETLRGLAADARSVTPTHRPAYGTSSPQSLLRVLIEHGIEQVHPTHAEELAVGLDRLADMCEAGVVERPIDELARLLRETLGLATHRLDAWITSVAAQRLAKLRADRPTGLQIGGYGWLVHLTPDTGEPDTHGFVHAPSLDHAATAAVLRSAWLACADGSANAAFGVNLSSERVRRAEWLLEGVRNGVDLAELLGARFERRLHDAGLDHLTADVREAVLIEAGHPDLPANAIVDGLALAVAYQEAESPLRGRIDALRVSLDGYPDDALLRTLQEATADLDATADALMAQSVHSLVKGNLAEAGAALAASGSGDAGIPELRMARVHRESQNVSHRVTAVFGNDRPASSSVLATAQPALAAWLESLLAGFDQVPVAGGDTPLRVGALGLGAAEVVALAATGGQLAGSRLAAVLLGLAELAGGPRPEASQGLAPNPGAGDAVTLGELAVVAGALRTAIGQARALRGEDLAGPGDAPPEIDVDELDRRRLAVADRLHDLAAAPPDDATLLSRAADLAAVDDAGTIAALGAQEAERRPLIAAVLAKAARRAAALRVPLPERWDEWSAADRVQHLATRIDKALALKLPVLARFLPTNGADLVASARLSERRLGSPIAAPTWLLQAGRVHAGTGRVDEALGLLAAVRGEPVTAEQVVQIPHLPDDPWVAVARPASAGGRTCVLSLTDLAAAVGEGPVSGLLFDAWTEPLPGPTATTGVAVHLDSPGAQPPQAVLIATVAPGERWSVDTLRTIVSQTLELAQIRAVGPETLSQWGHSLPAIFLPEGVAVSTVDDGEATTVARR